MTRNLRIQLADLAEAWLRAARPDLSRERATDLISDWPLALPWDEETTALVLSRFPAELVPVAGVHFLPQVQAEPTAVTDYQGDVWLQDPDGRWQVYDGDEPQFIFRNTLAEVRDDYGPLVEVTAQPTAEAVQCGFRVCDQAAAEGDEYCALHRNEHDSAMRGARAWDRAMGS